MTPTDRLVQAAAEALRRQSLLSETAVTWQEAAECALAAAFAALPVDEIREQARAAAAATGSAQNVYLGGVYKMADATSDVWISAFARENGEPTS